MISDSNWWVIPALLIVPFILVLLFQARGLYYRTLFAIGSAQLRDLEPISLAESTGLIERKGVLLWGKDTRVVIYLIGGVPMTLHSADGTVSPAATKDGKIFREFLGGTPRGSAVRFASAVLADNRWAPAGEWQVLLASEDRNVLRGV